MPAIVAASDSPALRPVAALFVRADSIYKTLPGVDAWDAKRDALRWPGGVPAVYHPPCRAWGAFAWRAKPRDGERECATWSVDRVRRFGGVIEHPVGSKLWPEAGLPEPGAVDAWGGWTLIVDQFWWGHRASKRTRLYIVGCERRNIPAIPLVLGEPTHVIGDVGRAADGTKRPEISKAEREKTPPDFACWLIELARRCRTQPPLAV